MPYNNNYETTPKEWIKNLDIESLNWDDKTWQEKLKGTTLKRIKPWMWKRNIQANIKNKNCLLYTSPSPRDGTSSRMPSSA